LHPKLAALPVIGEGSNILPIIHVSDLVASIELIIT
jgi:dTDP-D-glucose 4,6-dehydratase